MKDEDGMHMYHFSLQETRPNQGDLAMFRWLLEDEKRALLQDLGKRPRGRMT